MIRLFLGMITVCFFAAASNPVHAESPDDEGFQPLFNGTDLSEWKGREDLWDVQEGVITGRTTEENPLEQNTFLIWTEGKPSDFELRAQFKIDSGNSGIQYRSRVVDEDKFVVGGYQADIDAELKFAGINYEERGRGILALRGQRVTLKGENTKEVEAFGDAAEIGKAIKKNEWNDYRIVAKGNRLQHYINGQLTCEVIDLDEQNRASEGVIALQLHAGPPMVVRFKDLKIKSL